MKVSLPYFERWFFLGLVIGVITGLSITALYELVKVFDFLFIKGLVGMDYPEPLGEGGSAQFHFHAERYFLIPLAIALGGLLVGVISILVPEVEGSGTDYAIRSFHRYQGRMRWVVAPFKLLASALTIGSGGSAGEEGPSALISSSLASSIVKFLSTSPEDRRVAVAVGIGAGIGTILKAPIGGAVLSAEILYLRDLEPEVIYPSLVASSISYTIFGFFTGFSPIFGQYTESFDPLRLPLYAVLGVASGLVGILYARSFYAVNNAFKRISPRFLRPAIGGALAGCIALMAPEVLGEGTGWINLVELGRLSSLYSPVLPTLALLVLLPFLKIASTSLTVGSGGSGGVYVPALFIGAYLGGAMGLAFHSLFPGVVNSVAPFVVIGMMSVFAAAGKVPLSMIIMVTEMTESLQVLPGAMVAVALAYLVSGSETINGAQVPTRRDSPAHRAEYEVPVMRELKVKDCELLQLSASVDSTVEEARKLMEDNNLMSVPVTDRAGNFVGVVYMRELQGKRGDDPLRKYVLTGVPTVSPNSSLEHALEVMGRNRTRWVSVVEGDKLVGILTLESLFKAYEREVSRKSANQGPSYDEDAV
ncbi:MAG: chloride channel protein [Candidatus Aramenus sp.]|nr:chloride channel protein [Candidatus Aramenus sp.]